MHALALAFSPDDRRLALGDLSGIVSLFDTETLTRVAALPGRESEVPALAWSPDGKLLVTGGADGSVRLFDGVAGRALGVLGRHRKGVLGVDVDGRGELVASAAEDGLVRLFVLATRREVAAIRAPAPRVTAIAFDRRGQRLACASHVEVAGAGGAILRGVVKLWSLDALLRTPASKDVLAETQRETGLELPAGSLTPVPTK